MRIYHTKKQVPSLCFDELENGSLVAVGRIDQQVKIKYTIEQSENNIGFLVASGFIQGSGVFGVCFFHLTRTLNSAKKSCQEDFSSMF